MKQLAGAAMIGFAARHEGHRTTVVGPVHRQVVARMPGQALRLAAGHRDHVDIGIAVVVGGKGDALSIGREHRGVLVGGGRGQATRV